jgi:hypothetical protein
MRLSHAAGLALVGWYLMLPPFSREPLSFKNLPLSKWSIYKRYNGPDKCRQARSDITDGLLQDAPPDFTQRFGDTLKASSQERNAFRPTIRASRKSRMNPRHAAALVLGGWYLMVALQ